MLHSGPNDFDEFEPYRPHKYGMLENIWDCVCGAGWALVGLILWAIIVYFAVRFFHAPSL